MRMKARWKETEHSSHHTHQSISHQWTSRHLRTQSLPYWKHPGTQLHWPTNCVISPPAHGQRAAKKHKIQPDALALSRADESYLAVFVLWEFGIQKLVEMLSFSTLLLRVTGNFKNRTSRKRELPAFPRRCSFPLETFTSDSRSRSTPTYRL